MLQVLVLLPFIPMCILMYPCKPMYIHVYPTLCTLCILLYTHLHPCTVYAYILMYTLVYPCMPLYTPFIPHVYPCISLCTVCILIPLYTDVCPCICCAPTRMPYQIIFILCRTTSDWFIHGTRNTNEYQVTI